MEDKRKKPRWLQKLYADFRGYFWLPCVICGKPFGGHETSNTSLYHSWNDGQSICVNCEDEAKKRNKEFFKNNPPPIRCSEGEVINNGT